MQSAQCDATEIEFEFFYGNSRNAFHDIFVEKFGEKTSFWVRTEGQLFSAADYVLVDKKSGSRLKEPTPQQNDREQISQVEIENISSFQEKFTDSLTTKAKVLLKEIGDEKVLTEKISKELEKFTTDFKKRIRIYNFILIFALYTVIM